MRTCLKLANDSSFYMVVNENGIYYNNESSGNYSKIEGEHRGVRWYEDYIEEQLELWTRTPICPGDGLPTISLEGKPLEKASLEGLEACRRVCLAISTLRKLWHLRISSYSKSFVWCLPLTNSASPMREICATPYHAIRDEMGSAVTMGKLCADGSRGCVGKYEYVSKALLFTQNVGGYGVTFVAARNQWVRDLLLFLQGLIDCFVFILRCNIYWVICALFVIRWAGQLMRKQKAK